jgi:DNA-binding PadR family transcriptional regulator
MSALPRKKNRVAHTARPLPILNGEFVVNAIPVAQLLHRWSNISGSKDGARCPLCSLELQRWVSSIRIFGMTNKPLDADGIHLHTIAMKVPSPLEMQLLSLLGSDELSGREVAKKYLAETNRSISYGTLYTTFRRLQETGWVRSRDAEDEDGRLRYFALTGMGQHARNSGARYYSELLALVQKCGGLA